MGSRAGGKRYAPRLGALLVLALLLVLSAASPALADDAEIGPDLGNCEPRQGFAVAPDDSALYVATDRESPAGECEEGTPAITKLTGTGQPIHGRRVRVRRTVHSLAIKPLSMPTTLTGQNGDVIKRITPVKVSGCKLPARHKAKKKAKRR